MSDTEASNILLAPAIQIVLPNNGNKSPSKPRESSAFLIFAACTAALGGLLFGYDIGIISGALLQLKADFNLTSQNEEMVVSLMLIGALVASLIGGPIIDWIGSRWTIIANALIFVGGAIILALATNYSALLGGRFVVGFAVALSAVSECMYIAEISQAHNRGTLVTLNELGIAVGFLLAFLINYLFVDISHGWRYMFGLSAIPALIQVLAMLYLPNTPQYLLLHKRDGEAEAVLKKLRGFETGGNIRQELVHVRLSLTSGRQTSCWSLCSPVDNVRGCVALGAGLVLAQQFTGGPNVLYYAPEIFKQVGFYADKAALLANLGLGFVKLAATIASVVLVDRLGRRLSLLLGCSVIFVSMIALAVFAIAHEGLSQSKGGTFCNESAANLTERPIVNLSNDSNHECSSEEEMSAGWRYLALVSLMSYVAAYSFSFGPVTWLLLSEIFPPAIKGRAMAVTSGLNWAANWVVSSTFLQFIDMITLGGTFIFYGVMCFIGLVFIFATIPETKNKPLHKISQEMKESSFRGRFLEHLQELPCLKDTRWLLRISGHYDALNQSSYTGQDGVTETEII